jgi:hypothetical protein
VKSKTITRRDPSLSPRPQSSASRNLAIGLVLIAVGAVAALTIERIPSGAPAPEPAASRPASTRSPAPSAGPSTAAETPAAPTPTPAPTPSPTPASAILEAQLPLTIGTAQATITSASGASVLGTTPTVRALAAASEKLGHGTPMELGYAYDPAGVVSANVLAFRIPGVPASVLEPVILNDWLSVGAPGVSLTSDTLSGVAVHHVAYSDKPPDEWVLSRGDGVFIVEAPDRATAASIIAALRPAPPAPAGTPAPSGAGPSASPLPSATP